ncbi:MAG: ABC transporter permease [Balneolaceae bacterium]|nr:ABC transporter permease [Balneolaceae bacterium]
MIDFRKVRIIIGREYMTRVRGKAFILTTLLLPLGLIVFFAVAIGVQFLGSDTQYEFAVLDQTGEVYPKLAEIDSLRYSDYSGTEVADLRSLIMEGDLSGYVRITEGSISENSDMEMVHGGSGGIELTGSIRSDLRNAIREVRLDRAEVSGEIRSILDQQPQLVSRELTEEGEEEESNTMFYFFLGYMMAFIMYFAMFGYGGLVMRSVIEEKTNRIVEIIASSVKPFELLLGKILGVGLLGVTQFVVWVVAAVGILTFAGPIAASFMDAPADTAQQMADATGGAASAMPQIPAIDPVIGIYFVVFFVLGYLIYSAVFASIGSAVDSETDTQQLMLPLMLPIIIAILLLPKVASDPDSTIAVVSSLIPLLSPVLMIARIPITDVPLWELGLCIALMIGTIVGFLALGAKIYRVGILMYGKKASFKEIWKWMRA